MTNFITELLNLHKGEEDNQKTLANVKANISFTGANLWILACAIIVASVGLNVNSTAVIIGAMLISPLMGPIVGAGFALGIYDFGLLRRSLKNLLLATVVSLTVATLYFYLSPFKEVQSELLARTSPNIYDVLIAFFGGLVGVIAITRVEKGNPVPGVAIATALMPPLCTAGYGLATAHWSFFFGAMFLYCINCVFICIATFSIVKYLKYPAAKQIDIKHQKQVRYSVTAIVTLMLLPSAFFAFSLYKQQHFKELANIFIEKEFVENGNTLVYKKIRYATNPKTIELAFLQKEFTKIEVQKLNDKLKSVGLQNTKLLIMQNSSTNLQSFKKDILNEVSKRDNVLSEKDKSIALLEHKLIENSFDNKRLLSEINILFPNINALAVSKQSIASLDSTRNTTVLIYNSKRRLSIADKNKLKNWVLKRLGTNKIEITELEK
jgi:uncharacterized hydrophobic protein (TIGR00271 family)